MKLILTLLTFLTFQTPPTGSIEGTVVRYGTSDSIARVRVTLTPIQSSTPGQALITDGDGKFRFQALPAGQYRVSAARSEYVSSEYGQRGPNGSGTPLTLAAQQHVTDIRIGLTSTGAIGGRIVNRFGEPVGNANVQAMRYTYQDGRRVLSTVQTARSNDRGDYRLFYMTPGQYIVSAQPQEQVSMDPGGTMMFMSARGGGPAGLLGPGGPQLGVGGVTRITVTAGAAGPADFPGAGGPGGGAPPPLPPPAPLLVNPEAYLPVYYPGTTEITSAMPIDLRAGGSIEGVNLTMADVRPVRVRGQVLSGGRPASGAQVSIYQRSNPDGSVSIRSFTVNDTGMFEFRNVAPGSYEVAASVNGAGPGVMLLATPLGNAAGLTAANTVGGRGGRAPGQQVMGVRVPVDVTTADIDGLALVLENGFNVAGKVTIEAGSATDSASNLSGLRIQVQSDPMIPTFNIPPASPESDGTFSLTGVTSGTYRLQITGLPRNTYIKSARLLGNDVLGNGMRIDSEPRSPLDVVLGTTPGSLDVVTQDDKQMPEAAVTVVLVPEANAARRFMFRDGISDASGKLHWEGLAPGDYKAYAWEDVESGAWTDSEFMRAYEGRGTPVHIDERGRASVDVRVIPYRAN